MNEAYCALLDEVSVSASTADAATLLLLIGSGVARSVRNDLLGAAEVVTQAERVQTTSGSGRYLWNTWVAYRHQSLQGAPLYAPKLVLRTPRVFLHYNKNMPGVMYPIRENKLKANPPPCSQTNFGRSMILGEETTASDSGGAQPRLLRPSLRPRGKVKLAQECLSVLLLDFPATAQFNDVTYMNPKRILAPPTSDLPSVSSFLSCPQKR